MQRKRTILVVLAVCSLGLAAWVLGLATGPASGQVKAPQTAKVTIVNVTLGKPTELGFKLSKFSLLPAGTITFKVTNAGLGTHNFKICTTPVTSAAKNACVGKVTPLLKTGKSATITVTLTKSGKYEFLCSVPGHAAAGMKGLLGVGVKVSVSASLIDSTSKSPVPTPGQPPAPAPAPAPGGADDNFGCPPGVTVQSSGNGDNDVDERGGVDDGDGCI